MWIEGLDGKFERLFDDMIERRGPFDRVGVPPFRAFLPSFAQKHGVELYYLTRICLSISNRLPLEPVEANSALARDLFHECCREFRRSLAKPPIRADSPYRLNPRQVSAFAARVAQKFPGPPDVELVNDKGHFTLQITVECRDSLNLLGVSSSYKNWPFLQSRLVVLSNENQQIGNLLVPNAFLDLERGLVTNDSDFETVASDHLVYCRALASWLKEEYGC